MEDNKHVKEMLRLLPPYLPADTTAPPYVIPSAHIPPQQPPQLAATGPSPIPQQCYAKLSSPTIDDTQTHCRGLTVVSPSEGKMAQQHENRVYNLSSNRYITTTVHAPDRDQTGNGHGARRPLHHQVLWPANPRRSAGQATID
jgi:hypothetical protein